LILKARDDNAQYIDVPKPQIIDQLQGVRIVGDAEIGPNLLPFNISRIDAKEYIRLVFECLEEPHLHVGIVSGQHAGRVEIEEELAPELKV